MREKKEKLVVSFLTTTQAMAAEKYCQKNRIPAGSSLFQAKYPQHAHCLVYGAGGRRADPPGDQRWRDPGRRNPSGISVSIAEGICMAPRLTAWGIERTEKEKNMEKTVDAMGMTCPKPVILAKKEMDQSQPGDVIIVQVDNEVATENLRKLANSQEADYEMTKLGTSIMK